MRKLVLIGALLAIQSPARANSPIYASEWSMAASAGEWTLRSYMGGYKVLISCPRLSGPAGPGSLSVNYLLSSQAPSRPTAVVFVVKGQAKDERYPLTAKDGQNIWEAKSAKQLFKLLTNVETLTLSDAISLEGSPISAVAPSTDSLETIHMFSQRCLNRGAVVNAP